MKKRIVSTLLTVVLTASMILSGCGNSEPADTAEPSDGAAPEQEEAPADDGGEAGAKDYRTMKSSVYTALIASGVLCAALMLGGLASCDTLLRLMKTQPEVMADSALYLDIYIWGLPFLFFYNIATGIFSALGDSRTPFLFLALSSTANILIDILFVKGFSMGIAGVASVAGLMSLCLQRGI